MKSLYERLLDTEDNLTSGMTESMVMSLLGQLYELDEVEKVDVKPDGLYINGNLKCKDNKIKSLVIQGINIKYVSGRFICAHCKNLKTLEGVPEVVGNSFSCSYCTNLASLEDAPLNVNSFWCTSCDSITSLKGVPKVIEGDFYCNECGSLTSLKGSPEKVGGKFNCSGCDNLETLKGAPKVIGDSILCYACPKLKDYAGIPKSKIITFD